MLATIDTTTCANRTIDTTTCVDRTNETTACANHTNETIRPPAEADDRIAVFRPALRSSGA